MARKGFANFLQDFTFLYLIFVGRFTTGQFSSSQGLKPSMSTIYCFIEALPAETVQNIFAKITSVTIRSSKGLEVFHSVILNQWM